MRRPREFKPGPLHAYLGHFGGAKAITHGHNHVPGTQGLGGQGIVAAAKATRREMGGRGQGIVAAAKAQRRAMRRGVPPVTGAPPAAQPPAPAAVAPGANPALDPTAGQVPYDGGEAGARR